MSQERMYVSRITDSKHFRKMFTDAKRSLLSAFVEIARSR